MSTVRRTPTALVTLVACLALLVVVPVTLLLTRSPTSTGAVSAAPDAPASPVTAPGAVTGRRGATAAPPNFGGAAVPVSVTLPRLRLEGSVEPVGVSPDGQMALPEPGLVGWYRYGPAPGATAGSAVLAGHLDSRTGPGVFARLSQTRSGDLVRVTLADARRLDYRVATVSSVVKSRLPTADIFSRTGTPRLTLVTCGGAYAEDAGGYEENVLVVAVPVGGPHDASNDRSEVSPGHR